MIPLAVKDNLEVIQREIEAACQRVNRDPNDVKIIAVTKYVSVETTKEALDVGVSHIGENRVEGATKKYDVLGDRGIWHFIGSLQSKKVRKMIDKFSYIHSLDRLSLAKEIQKRVPDGKTVNCFVQLNISGEETKSGITADELIPFIKSIEQFPAIRIIGLMTMAPFYENSEETRPIFQKLKQLQKDVQALQFSFAPCDELSMGMSNDYIVAVEEGATFVRIGSSLVGNEKK